MIIKRENGKSEIEREYLGLGGRKGARRDASLHMNYLRERFWTASSVYS